MAQAGIRGGPPPAPQGEPTPEMLESMAQMQRNMGFWFGSGYFGSIGAYEPDFNALKNCSCRIVSAVGDESRDELAHRATVRAGEDHRFGSKPLGQSKPTAATPPNSPRSCAKCWRPSPHSWT